MCKSGNIDARLAAVSRGLAIGSLFTNRNICSTVRSLANFHSFQRTSNQPLLFRQRERERECTCYFPDCSRGAHVHTYAVRLSLVEALKAPLCSDRSVLLLEFDERPEIGIQVEGNLKLEEKLSVSIPSNRYVSSWSNLARIKTWLLKMMRIVMINLISVYHCN